MGKPGSSSNLFEGMGDITSQLHVIGKVHALMNTPKAKSFIKSNAKVFGAMCQALENGKHDAEVAQIFSEMMDRNQQLVEEITQRIEALSPEDESQDSEEEKQE